MAHINFGIQKNTHTHRGRKRIIQWHLIASRNNQVKCWKMKARQRVWQRWGWQHLQHTYTHKNNKKKRNKRRFKFIVIRWTIIKLSDFWFCSNPHQQQRTEQSASVSMCERAQMKSITAIMACLVEQRAYFDGWNKYKGNWWLTTEERVKLFRIPVCVSCCLSVDLMHD